MSITESVCWLVQASMIPVLIPGKETIRQGAVWCLWEMQGKKVAFLLRVWLFCQLQALRVPLCENEMRSRPKKKKHYASSTHKQCAKCLLTVQNNRKKLLITANQHIFVINSALIVCFLCLLWVVATVEDHYGRHQVHSQIWVPGGGGRPPASGLGPAQLSSLAAP